MQNNSRAKFSDRALYRAALRYVRVLHVHYSLITDYNPRQSRSCGFGDFLEVKVPHTKSTMPNVPDIFTNDMRLFQDELGVKKESVKLQKINRQERGNGRIQCTLFRGDPVRAPSSAPPVSSYEPQQEEADSSAIQDPSMPPKRDM